MPLSAGHYSNTNPDWDLDGKPSGFFRSNIKRSDLQTDVAAALTTQVMLGVAMHLNVGETVSKIGFMVGATGQATVVDQWVALYDNSATPKLLGQATDTLTAAITASTLLEYSLATPVTVTATGIYICALMVKASVPSLLCKVLPVAAAGGPIITGQAPLAATSGSSLSTTAPATWASPTTVVNVPYVTVR